MSRVAALALAALPLLGWTTLALAQEAPEPVEEGDPYEGEYPEDDYPEEALEEAEAAPVPSHDVAAMVAKAVELRGHEFSGSAYEFCTDPEFEPKTGRASRFCKTVDPSVEAVCPQAARLCRERERRQPFQLPDWALYTLMTIAVVVLGLGLGWFLVSVLRQWRRQDGAPLTALSPSPLGLDLQSLPEAAALVLLREAEQRLQEGRAPEAALLLHAAALRHLDDTGLASFHPSRTNGEYVRALRPHRDLAALFREIAGATDRLRFGDGSVDAARTATLIEEARRLFSAPRERGLGLSSVTAGLIALVWLGGCEGQDSSFFSHRPEGLSALPALLAQAGVRTSVVRRLPAEVAEDVGVVVLRAADPSLTWTGDGAEIDALLGRDLGVLVLDEVDLARALLPVTSTVALDDLVPQPEAAAVAVTDEYFCRFDQASFLEEVWRTLPGDLVVPRGVTLLPLMGEGPLPLMGREAELIPLLTYAEDAESDPKVLAYGALRQDGTGGYRPGCLVVFAGSEVFSNAALSRAKNVAYAVGLITSMVDAHESVLFVDGIGRTGAGGAVGESMRSSKALPFVLHAGLWVAVLFVAMGAAFGRLRDPVRTEHKAFREHAEALGLYYAASGEAGRAHAAEALARLVVARYRHRVRGGTQEAWAALAADLAERHELDGREVLSALSSGLEENMRVAIREDVAPLAPERSLEISSKILSNEGHLGPSKKGS